MYSYGDVSRLPSYGRDDKAWLYDQTKLDNVVRLENGVVRYARRLYDWIGKEKAA